MKKTLCILMVMALCLIYVPVTISANAATMDDLTYEISNGQVSVIRCQYDARGEMIIPDMIEGYPVTGIANGAFAHCDQLTCITIPDSVTYIGEYAFSWCSKLTGIWVSENNPTYKSDDRGVLFTKDGTTLIQAPCTISGHYSIPSGVIHIGNYAFSGCSQLTGVTIPEGVVTIGRSAFSSCYLLADVTIPESMISIGDWAFTECAFTSLTIPGSVNTIGYEAFYFCNNLKDVYFTGDAPKFDFCVFRSVSANVYYHTGTTGWETVTSYSLTGYYDSITLQKTDHQYIDGLCIYCGQQYSNAPIGGRSGDLNGDGKVNVADVSKLYAHIKGRATIIDDDLLLCADITGDGLINIADVSKVYAAVKAG